MNYKNVNSILQQAHALTEVQSSEFWSKLRVIQKINYTAQRLLEALSTVKLLRFLQKAVRSEAEGQPNAFLFGDGLLPKGGYTDREPVSNADFNRLFESGLLAWSEVCGQKSRRIGREKDHAQFAYRLFLSHAKFTSAQHQVPFVELMRSAFKKEQKKGPSDDFAILRGIKDGMDCHKMIKNGQWMQAADQLLILSNVRPVAGQEPLFDALGLESKTELLEFATVIVFLLKFRQCFLPDYALRYVDAKTDFS